MHASFAKSARNAIPLHAVPAKDLKPWLARMPYLKASGFSARDGELRLIPGPQKGNQRGVAGAVLGLGKTQDALALAAFSEKLPDGVYRLGEAPDFCGGTNAALAWLLGLYEFARYRKPAKRALKLVPPEGVDGEEVSRIAAHVFLARDLINTPPNDMGPEELAAAAAGLAKEHGARFRVVTGALLAKNYPLIHAVGQGSVRAPRLIEMVWGSGPKVTLVGKGVCFDTGGYDIKPASGMATMKKDMGGAAVALAVAGMVMGAGLQCRLRVLIPAVENSISGAAYRPSDVFKSRKGLTVEIGNTDAEGRLVLADALADADEEAPELLIDIATLTGAARMATGMELPPFFTDNEILAADLTRLSKAVSDPLWRLPLWRGYESTLSSPVADLTNSPNYGYAGAITAALFLNRFVEKAASWVHLDIAAWTDRPRPGRKLGGEANAARALYALLKERYGR
ncbi:MAG TPA: leucyl aminopeptidase family protein [Rhizomicrobium sp.]|nr:leucyl aminopeptidase family protein [Rhizomicrobium sp.]